MAASYAVGGALHPTAQYRARYRLLEIQTRHWRALAERYGGPETFEPLIVLVQAVEAALERVNPKLPAGFPEGVWESISRGMVQQRDRFLPGLD